MKKFSGLIAFITLVFVIFTSDAVQVGAETAAAGEATVFENRSVQLVTDKNRLINSQTGEIFRLTGVNVPSLEWTAEGEHVYTSVAEALDNWNANVIRLPLSTARWNGLAKEQKGKGSVPYRRMIDEVVKAAGERGKYVILDCHWSDAGQTEILRKEENANTSLVNSTNAQHKMPDEGVREFWLEVAAAYANNPSVMFGLYNEPYGVSWDVWRNGGEVTDKAAGNMVTFTAVGHQQLVEAIRDAGAKNVIVAGGLDYAYSLTGVAGKSNKDTTVYALEDSGSGADDSKRGYGIMYDTHIYPWKGNSDKWQTAVGCVLNDYPVIVGENGWEKQTNESQNISVLKTPKLDSEYWVNELFSWIDNPTDASGNTTGVPLNWTAWTFHPNSQPTTFSNWYYEPTPFWGSYVRERLRSYTAADSCAKNYIMNFNADDDLTARYVDQNNKTVGNGSLLSRTYTESGVRLAYSGSESAVKLEPLPKVSFKGIQSLSVAVTPSSGGTAEIGIAETDGELWLKQVKLSGGVENKITVPISDLVLTPFEGADGIFSGVAAAIYIKPTGNDGNIVISQILIDRGGSETGVFSYSTDFHKKTVEYVVSENDIGAGETPVHISTGDIVGADVLHFLCRGEGLVDISVIEGTERHRMSEAITANGEWRHIKLHASNFDNLSDFSNVTGIEISGGGDAVARHITFTNIEPPQYCPNSDYTVDYCVDFEDGGDVFYKTEYDPSCLNVSEVETEDGIALGITVKKGGDILLAVNPSGAQTHVSLRGAKTLSFDIKGDGTKVKFNMGVMGTKTSAKVPIILEDDNWHRITYNLAEIGAYIPQFISGVKFYMSSLSTGTYLVDNISFSSDDTVIPSEGIIEDFDEDSSVLGFDGNYRIVGGLSGNGCRMILGKSAAEARLIKRNLEPWQRDLSAMRFLSFAAKTDNPGQTVSVVLKDTDGKTCGEYEFAAQTAGWESVVIPLCDGAEPLKTADVECIVFLSDAEITICIDDIALTKCRPKKSSLPLSNVVSDMTLIVCDDFERNCETENSDKAITVSEDGNAGWRVYGASTVMSRMGLFIHSDFFNPSRYLSTASNREIYNLTYKNSKAVLHRDFVRPDNSGITTVDMRVKCPAYGDNEITLYETSAANLSGNKAIARVAMDTNGGLTYKNEYLSENVTESTKSDFTLTPGGWVYIRFIVDSATKTVKMYCGHSYEYMTPWNGERDTFNFAANNTKAPYVTADEGFSSIAVSGRGVVGIDDVAVYHKLADSAPTARDVRVVGVPKNGETLKASYTFYDSDGYAEGESVGYWESSSKADFSADVKTVSERTAVTAADGSQYTVTASDRGRYLRFSVIPRSAKGTPADRVYSYVCAKAESADAADVRFVTNGMTVSRDDYISGETAALISVTNTTDSEAKIGIFVAEYGKGDGMLIAVQKTDVVVPANSAEPITFGVPKFNAHSGRLYRIMVCGEGMRPLAAAVSAQTENFFGGEYADC